MLIQCKKDDSMATERIYKIDSDSENRVLLHDEDSVIPITTTDIGYDVNESRKKEVKLKYKATIKPPKINGNQVKATSISIDDGNNIAYVSYNTEGNEYLGAVDIIDISNIKKPQILTTLKLTSTDVSSIYASPSNQKLFLATATSDAEFSAPAVLESINLTSSGDYKSPDFRSALTSFVATDVKEIDDVVYSISGNTGALFKTDLNGSSTEKIKDIDDARWIHYNSNKIVVLAGTPAKIYVFNRFNLSLEATYSPGGANIAESKSQIHLHNNYMYVAAGDEGCKILELKNGNEVFSVENPKLNQLSSEKTVCNSVAVYNDYIFKGNGEAGVYVLQHDGDPSNSNINGNLKFKKNKSVNHLTIHNGHLFVARGLGGFIIAEISE